MLDDISRDLSCDDSSQSKISYMQANGSLQLNDIVQLHQDLLDAMPMMLAVCDVLSRTEFQVSVANRAASRAVGLNGLGIIGKQLTDIFSPEEAARSIYWFQSCMDADAPLVTEKQFALPSGHMWAQTTYVPMHAADGHISRILLIVHDITAVKERELAEQQRQAEIIVRQSTALAELSTPLLTISDTTMVMPIIGAIDSQRVQQIMKNLLTGVAEQRARAVIVDITGVPVVDTQVASALVQVSQAVSLLGSQVILTGIRPEVAQTLVGLGVELREIITRGTLRDGISYALQRDQQQVTAAWR